jgi:tRNA A37 threonylcarbamoyladenosine modification protein TsaB
LNGQIPSLIAVGIGPGSYTGIRVGAALAKTLAYGWNIPLLGFCSLKAFEPLPVLIDARMGGFYALLDNKPLLLPPSSPLLQNLPSISSPHPELIQKRLISNAIYTEVHPTPKSLSQIVYRQFLEEGAAPFELAYLTFP